MIKVIK